MQHIATPVIKITNTFEILAWTSTAEEFLMQNFQKEIALGLALDRLFPKKISDKFKTDFKKKEGVLCETYPFSASKNIEIISSPCLEADGKLKFFSLCLKVAPKVNNEFSKNITQLKNIIENSNLAIFLTDPNGPILDVNRAACKMFGYTVKELTRLSREDVIKRDFDLDQAVRHRDETGELRMELTGIRKNGENFPCEVHSVIYVNTQGEKRTSTTIVDISDRKKQELLAENSKQAFQSLFDHNPDAVYSFDLKGNFLDLNERAINLLESSGENVRKINFLPLIAPEDRERVTNYSLKAVSGEVQRYQTSFLSLKGTRKILDVTNFPIYVNKKITGIYGIAKDITKQVEIEQKLREEHNMFRAIIDYIPDHIFVVNEKHKTILTNRSFYKNYYGVENEQDSLGLTALEFFEKEEAVKVLEDNTRVMNLGIPVINREDVVENFNGRKDYTLLSKIPFRYGDNKTGLVGISRNITEIKEKEKALEELNTALKQHAEELALSNQELEQFAYIASHDLQEPLRMVTSFLTQLKKKYQHQLDDKAQQYIYFAHDGATRMRQIILDLLEYSRVGRLEHQVTIVNLENLVAEVLSLHKKSIDDKKAKIELGKLPSLEVEEPLLRQLFSNLIGNALKYSSKERSPEIKISSIEKEKYWQFEISDNGIGIEEEFLEQIFVIFQRLHQRDEYEGTGIGLAICKKIVDNFGGKIWVNSIYGKGSSFYFTIPKQF